VAPTSDVDVLRLIAADPHGMVGEELLHELGFNGTDAAIAEARSQGWIALDEGDVYRVTALGQEALDSTA
jgi:hypothetical protein